MSTARAVGTAPHDRPELFGLPSRRSAGAFDPWALLPNEALLAPAVVSIWRAAAAPARREAILGGSTAAVRGYGSQIATCRCLLVPAASSHRRNRSRTAAGCKSRGIACWHLAGAAAAPGIHRAGRPGAAGAQPEISSAFLGASSVGARHRRRRPSIVAAAQRCGSATRCSGWWWWKKRPIRFSVCAIRRSNA